MKARDDGFSLVEVLIAITLIGFIALSVAPMFVIASRSNLSASHLGTCSALAMKRMELLRTTTLSSLSVGGSLTSDVAGYASTENGDFVVRWRISDLSDPPDGKLIEVRSLSLRPSIGPNKQITFMTSRVP